MNSFLLNRQLGFISQHAFTTAQSDRLLRSLQAAPKVDFLLGDKQEWTSRSAGYKKRVKPHTAGVNSIAIDRFEGR